MEDNKPHNDSSLSCNTEEAVANYFDSTKEFEFDTSFHEVYRIRWDPEDLLEKLIDLLDGTSANDFEKRLVTYVGDNIEPAGWYAVWRSNVNATKSLLGISSNADLIVNVVNVSTHRLEANVIICYLCNTSEASEELVACVEEFKDISIDVPLYQLYPLVNQENENINMPITAEVIEQIRIFFSYIWQPWDKEEEICYYDQQLIKQRLRIMEDIKSGKIPRITCSKMKLMRQKACMVHKQIENVEETMNEVVEEKDVLILMELHKQMEKFKSQYELFQDPVMQELLVHHRVNQNKFVGGKENVLLVINEIKVNDLIMYMNLLPSVLDSLPNVHKNSKTVSFPNLQSALDRAAVGDTVIIFSGKHVLSSLGEISKGGTICGLWKDVIIEASSDTGDVMFDITLGSIPLNLCSIKLLPLPGQVGIILHNGELIMRDVKMSGGDTGLIVLNGGECHLKDCLIEDSKTVGVDSKGSSILSLVHSKIINKGEAALQMTLNSKVSAESCKFSSPKGCSICIALLDGESSENFRSLSKVDCINSILCENSANIFESKEQVMFENGGLHTFNFINRHPSEDFLDNICFNNCTLHNVEDF